MFEHLDEPEPYAPPIGLRTMVEGRVRRRRRRRVAVAGGVASVAVLGVGTVGAVRARLEPERIEVGSLADRPDDEQGEGLAADDVHPDDPVTALVVGTDQTEGDGRGRADTIGLVRIDPEAGEVRLLTVPRDLVLTAAGQERRAAQVFADGGPELLIRAVTGTLGVDIHHYVQVDFRGAIELVDAIGGIRVAVERPIRAYDGSVTLAAGCQELDGAATLGLGRARRIDVQQDDGGWATDPTSALGREQRGAAVAAALLQAAGRVGVGDLPALVETGLGSITVDADLAVDDVVRWARDARDDRFVPLGLPVALGELGPSQVLRLADGAAGVVAALVEGGADPVPVVVDGAPVEEATGLRPC